MQQNKNKKILTTSMYRLAYLIYRKRTKTKKSILLPNRPKDYSGIDGIKELNIQL